MKNRVCIINCWFGKLPNYFGLWLNSCKYNPNFNFLFVTDQELSEYKISKNIKVLNIEFERFVELTKEKLSLKNIRIDKPYKLCDFKPVYGIILQDYLKDFDFWGNCDIDMCFGNLEKYINDTILNKYDKILNLGHLTLYRNNTIVNNMYKSKGAAFSYKKVFTSKYNYGFDEESGIKSIFDKQKLNTYKEIDIADIDVKYTRFRLYDKNNYYYQIFYWENGGVYRAYLENNRIKIDEFCYIHFQKRKINVNFQVDSNIKAFYMQNSSFDIKNESIDENNIKTIADINTEEKETIELKRYKKKKLYQFFLLNIPEKFIYIKRKMYS